MFKNTNNKYCQLRVIECWQKPNTTGVILARIARKTRRMSFFSFPALSITLLAVKDCSVFSRILVLVSETGYRRVDLELRDSMSIISTLFYWYVNFHRTRIIISCFHLTRYTYPSLKNEDAFISFQILSIVTSANL